MYDVSEFKEQDQTILYQFIEEYPFAFLTGSFLSGEPAATQLPVILENRNGTIYLQGHIMRNSDHHQAFIENPNALLVFSGPHAYVSATWYTQPQSASTWNYMSVHAQGKMEFMSEEAFMTFMRKFTLKFEGNNTESLTVLDQLPESYVQKLMPAIIGFEMKVDHLKHVFKLSQNKDEASYTTIQSKLAAKGGMEALLAEVMQKKKSEFFPPQEQ